MEHQKCGTIEAAAMKANMSPKTASKYIKSGELPSAQVKERDWLTREVPFEMIWPEVEQKLDEAPELQGKALFEWFPNGIQRYFRRGNYGPFSARLGVGEQRMVPQRRSISLKYMSRESASLSILRTWIL